MSLESGRGKARIRPKDTRIDMSVIFGLLFDLFYPCSEWQSMFFTRRTEGQKKKGGGGEEKKKGKQRRKNPPPPPQQQQQQNNNNKAATTKDKANKQTPPSKQQHQNTYKFCDALLFRRRTSLMTCIDCIDEYRTVSILYRSWKSHVFLRAQDVVLQWLYIILCYTRTLTAASNAW